MKVHVVEDEPALLQAVTIALERANHTVSCSTDGMHAAAETIRIDPDVALVDIMLPGKDGFAVIQEMRNKKFKKPVVVFTNSNTADFDDELIMRLKIKKVIVKASTPISQIVASVEEVVL